MLTPGNGVEPSRGSLTRPYVVFGAVALIGTGVVWSHFERKRWSAADAALRAEVARLESKIQAGAVSGDHSDSRNAALAPSRVVSAMTGHGTQPSASPSAEPGEGLSPQRDLDPRELLEAQQAANQQAAERVGNELDEYLGSEPVDPAWSSGTTRAIGATLLPLAGYQLLTAECRTRMCRVVVQGDSVEELRGLAQNIAGNGPFNQDVFYRYDFEEVPPKVTLYVAREGTPLGSLIKQTGPAK